MKKGIVSPGHFKNELRHHCRTSLARYRAEKGCRCTGCELRLRHPGMCLESGEVFQSGTGPSHASTLPQYQHLSIEQFHLRSFLILLVE
ncbi:MAG: hypothetical protein V3U76_12805 [Granulosicoccus sp.]